LFEVVGGNVYFVSPASQYTLLGTIPNGITPVNMADNGNVILMVDGSLQGWAIDMTSLAFKPVNDPYFLGGSHVTYLDGFFILNVPSSQVGVPGFGRRWYISLFAVTFDNLCNGVMASPPTYFAFDANDWATKGGYPDAVLGVIACHRNLWIVGSLYSEVWYNTGGADFPFSIIPGVYVEHGVIAPYSIASQDLVVFWLTRDRYGIGMVLEGDASFQVKQISPRGLEAIFASFETMSDAIGAVYDTMGHFYYVLSFPSVGRTFQYEKNTGEWNELAYTAPNGLQRHRGQGWAQAHGKLLCYDYDNGRLYQMDSGTFTDDGAPITRVRTIPHLVNEGKRAIVNRLIADLQGGTLGGNLAPKCFLRVSTDRGGSFSDPIEGMFGDTGDYAGMPFWTNLGIARDFVFELSWSAPINTALNGLFIEVTPSDY
jgi:hypothetical protein